MKTAVAILFLMLCLPLSGCDLIKSELDAFETKKRCKELKIWMSEQEVVNIMGHPLGNTGDHVRGLRKFSLKFDLRPVEGPINALNALFQMIEPVAQQQTSPTALNDF